MTEREHGSSCVLARSIGLAGAPNSDNQPRVRIPDFYYLNRALSDFDRTHNLHITNLTELPFGRDRRWLNEPGVLSAILGGWQVNNILSFYSGRPFSVTASGTSLNSPGNTQMADQIKDTVQIFGGVGRGNPYFDPLAFAPVTEARFGNAASTRCAGRAWRSGTSGCFGRSISATGPICSSASRHST